jgi:hypothetical protein
MATAPQPNILMDIINSIARGAPQAITGFVDLAGLPFTASGLLDPKQVVGSTAYLTKKGLLPQPSQGLLGQSVEAISGGVMPLSPAAMRATQAVVETTGKALAPKNILNKAMEAKIPQMPEGVIFENLHPTVQAKLIEGAIQPYDAQMMSDYAFTPGSSTVETGTDIYKDLSEKMQNYLLRIKNKEVTNPWSDNIEGLLD